jgi:hypothetical protein
MPGSNNLEASLRGPSITPLVSFLFSLSPLNQPPVKTDKSCSTRFTIMAKAIITFIALPFMISLSEAARFSCARDLPHEKIVLSKDAPQQICAMYIDNLNGIRGAPLPDKEQFATPLNGMSSSSSSSLITNNNAERLREEFPECGYFDGLGHRVSEQEYQLELDYELEHGVPYPPHLRPEAGSLSVHAHSDSQCGGEVVGGKITQPDVCYPVGKGMGVSVTSLPANCEVMGYAGEVCEGEPVEVVPLGGRRLGVILLELRLLLPGLLGACLLSVSRWLTD